MPPIINDEKVISIENQKNNLLISGFDKKLSHQHIGAKLYGPES
jgi:hypothetical protein